VTKKNLKKPIKKQSFYIRDSISETDKVIQRQNLLSKLSLIDLNNLSDLTETHFSIETVGTKNCENLTGSVEVPVGVAGPVEASVSYKDINNTSIQTKTDQSFIIPLATTEGALVASIHRGLKVLSAGKTSVLVKKMGMSRSVVFELDSALNVHRFILFFKENESKFAMYCEETSNHLKYISYDSFTRGKLVFFRFVFDTEEAMGMNMVTIALSYAWEKFRTEILDVQKEFNVELLTLSGNVCTDKKDSAINRLYGRGYAVIAETQLSKDEVEALLKVTPEHITKVHTVKNLVGSNVAGSLSQNMHVANALAAFYLATGQDIAHTVAGSEASVHFEVTKSGGLYVSLTMPNVSVGSIGGGTWLPAQNQARSVITKGVVTAKDLATAAGLACLAGELSGMAALSTHTLASAHAKLGRVKKGRK
jgi:hydroxymethylglutaryl-CoA reductase (NADPH)